VKAISIRNIPDDVYDALKAMAKSSRRSLQEEVRHLLEREVSLTQGSSLSRAGQWRSRLAGRKHADTVASIREDRGR